jgi:hypothetical protein
MEKKKEENSKHILTSFNYDYIKTFFSGDLTLSIIYFLSILIFIIIIFSTDYITISVLFSIYFFYLFFHQIYKIYHSKDKEIGYTTIIIPSFLIVVAIIVNFILPRNESISDDINNPNMEGSVIVIIYSTIIYSILFTLFLVYNTYNNNKFLLLGISIFFIISYILFEITKNSISSSSTNTHKKNTIFTNILLLVPCLFSIVYLFFFFINHLKNILGFGLSTGQSNLLYNPKFVEKIQEDPTIQTMSAILNKNYVNILILFYYIIIFICFVIFLVSANKTTTSCNFGDYSIYVLNALIIVILLYLTIEMTNRGKIKMESDTFAKYFNLPKKNLLENVKLDMTSDDNSKIFFLIIYNIIISKVFNDDCFSIMNKYPSLIILISYAITIGIYYKIINSENKSKNASNLLLYFIVLILFIAVILSINTSKVGSISSFNGTISPYIYSIIAFSIIFGVSYIYIYVKTLNSSVKDNDFIKSLTYSLFILFGLFFFFTLINWIIVLFKTFTFTKSSILGIILNVAIIITLMAILFKMISYSSYYKESPFLQVVIGSIFYIPCLFISLLNRITGIYKSNRENISSGFNFNWTDFLLLITIIVLYILYFNFTNMYTKYSSQGGNLLLKEPLNTDSKKLLSSYDSLVTQENQVHSYNYGLSCWLFIDGNNTNDIFYSLIDYGGKPNIQYRGSDNTFMITIDNKLVNGQPIKEKENLDEFGNIIIYKNNDLLLQKWNNIVINYKSGILDIFINGELIQSFKSYIPYMRKDNITCGDKNGNHGGICNVVYFDKSLNLVQIQNLYNSVKDLNPPILLNFYDNLFIHSLKIENITHALRLNQIDTDKYLTL